MKTCQTFLASHCVLQGRHLMHIFLRTKTSHLELSRLRILWSSKVTSHKPSPCKVETMAWGNRFEPPTNAQREEDLTTTQRSIWRKIGRLFSPTEQAILPKSVLSTVQINLTSDRIPFVLHACSYKLFLLFKKAKCVTSHLFNSFLIQTPHFTLKLT